MSISLVQNRNAVIGTPSNGCCAGISDIASPTNIGMTRNGTPGTTPINFTPGTITNQTALYYLTSAGDMDGLTVSAGAWTIPIFVQTLSGSPTLNSIYICIADSATASLGTIGSLTGLSAVLASGLNSFSVTGAQTTFATGNRVVISFQFTNSGAGTTVLTRDQTILTPGAVITAPGVVWPPLVAGWYKRRKPFFGAVLGPAVFPMPRPYVLSIPPHQKHPGRVVLSQLPRPVPVIRHLSPPLVFLPDQESRIRRATTVLAPVSAVILLPHLFPLVRHVPPTPERGALLYRSTAIAPKINVAGGIHSSLVVRRDYWRGAFVAMTGGAIPPLAPPSPPPPPAPKGTLSLMSRGRKRFGRFQLPF